MKDDRVYLLHIRDAIKSITDYTQDGENAFFESRQIQDAVIRNLEIMGEAAKQVSDVLKNKHGAIPWKHMAGMRDKLIHEYFGVNLDLVWNVVADELPELLDQIQSILGKTQPF